MENGRISTLFDLSTLIAPPWTDSTLAFDPSSLKLALTMTGQSIFKHFLTEGDRIVISRVSPLEDQGGYAVASNYGSHLTVTLNRVRN
jgi:hypothetical protein